MKIIINKKTLFLNKLASKLILTVLALKALKIEMKINNPKKAVMKYSSFIPFLKK